MRYLQAWLQTALRDAIFAARGREKIAPGLRWCGWIRIWWFGFARAARV